MVDLLRRGLGIIREGVLYDNAVAEVDLAVG
jgi:hypothetical protein